MAQAPDRPPGAPGPAQTGWLPDCVYTGERFEEGMAFFCDDLGRITRFSREPADLAAARRLAGQAALPGLVNAHGRSFERSLRGRVSADLGRALERLTPESIFDTARMAFLEMLLCGVTCAGEFHTLLHQSNGEPWPERGLVGRELIRAARSAGLRLALLPAACARAGGATARAATASADSYIAETEALREFAAGIRPGDEAWVGVGIADLGGMPPEYLKAVAAYAHAGRLRLHASVSARVEDNAACAAAHGRSPAALAAQSGLLDKRFTALHASHLSDEDVRILGSAHALVCACPASARMRGEAETPLGALLAAGASFALGTDGASHTDLWEDARVAAPRIAPASPARKAHGPELAQALFHAATVAGARSLGGPGGALEVGRPADFFTVTLFDPALAGAEPAALLHTLVFSPARRAVRDVWVGGRQRIAGGRHADQGGIVGRFVDQQRRLWA